MEVIGNTKHLCVKIDENLTWKNQIKSVNEKACVSGFTDYHDRFKLYTMLFYDLYKKD